MRRYSVSIQLVFSSDMYYRDSVFGFLIFTLMSRLLIVCIWKSGVFDLLLSYVLGKTDQNVSNTCLVILVNRLRNLENFWSSLIWYATTLFSLIYVQFDFLKKKKKDRTIIQTVFWSDSSSLWTKKIKNYSSKISTLRPPYDSIHNRVVV